MTMVRVEYQLAGSEKKETVRGWDFHLEEGSYKMERSVWNKPDGSDIKIEPVTLGEVSEFVHLQVRPCDGTINEHLEKCRQWAMTDEEIEALLE